MPDYPWTRALNLLHVWGPEEEDGLRSVEPDTSLDPVFEFIALCDEVWALTIQKRSD